VSPPDIISKFKTKKEAANKQLKTEMAKFLEIDITNSYFFLKNIYYKNIY